jgi:hypothetical protein
MGLHAWKQRRAGTDRVGSSVAPQCVLMCVYACSRGNGRAPADLQIMSIHFAVREARNSCLQCLTICCKGIRLPTIIKYTLFVAGEFTVNRCRKTCLYIDAVRTTRVWLIRSFISVSHQFRGAAGLSLPRCGLDYFLRILRYQSDRVCDCYYSFVLLPATSKWRTWSAQCVQVNKITKGNLPINYRSVLSISRTGRTAMWQRNALVCDRRLQRCQRLDSKTRNWTVLFAVRVKSNGSRSVSLPDFVVNKYNTRVQFTFSTGTL